MGPADNHVHTEWSWDTGPKSSMIDSCVRAVELGLPGIAFTEHVDFITWGADDLAVGDLAEARQHSHIAPLDVEGYLASVAECRERFPDLRIWTGIETGEPHLFSGSVAAVLARGRFDRILGSLHSLPRGGYLVGVGSLLTGANAYQLLEDYVTELTRMVESSSVFEVLAHLDFPRRYWPRAAGEFDDRRVEEQHRTLFRSLAGSDRVLEINTASPLASATMIRWWYEEGGAAVSFGSDAHQPARVAQSFDLAVDVVEAAGFRPGRDRHDFWRR